ncbi:MAG: universal stress protein [Holophaga sp.]|jgi:nucleotide-binding universal stress UspA family protein
MFDNILLAAENVDHSIQAAKVAGETARAMNSSSLCIVVAYPPVPDFLGAPVCERVSAARLTRAEAVVETTLVVSQEQGSDLIVMGLQEPGPLGHLVAGHESEAVVDQARCPVMIVR